MYIFFNLHIYRYICMSRRYIIFNIHCYYCHVFVFIPMMTQVPDGPKRLFFLLGGYHKKVSDEMTGGVPPQKNKPWFINPGLTRYIKLIWFTMVHLSYNNTCGSGRFGR